MGKRSESLLEYLRAGGVTIEKITLKEIEAELKKNNSSNITGNVSFGLRTRSK